MDFEHNRVKCKLRCNSVAKHDEINNSVKNLATTFNMATLLYDNKPRSSDTHSLLPSANNRIRTLY